MLPKRTTKRQTTTQNTTHETKDLSNKAHTQNKGKKGCVREKKSLFPTIIDSDISIHRIIPCFIPNFGLHQIVQTDLQIACCYNY